MWHRFRRSRALLAALPVILAALGCVGSSREESQPKEPVPSKVLLRSANPGPETKKAVQPEDVPNQINIDNFAYSPRKLTVTAGTRVTWVNRDDVPHTATSTARPRSFDSGILRHRRPL